MIGGEAAELAALERRPVAEGERDPHGLGWVMDWMYGDAVLPPAPLPRDPEPVLPWRRPLAAPEVAPVPRAARPGRRRARQLALL